ncbi:hypothetical protein SAMN05443633_105183 [Chryseobacterium arachidis]|uniref:Uncharacterized protein n=1 Tax=Chryseobacterium arachidis TaxID=1416778 RepID=A0A1M5D895_9FLAO|nr:hypothetical protein [Chryseobacterium arachidis]SHF63090.1 hypothetical protein SAMN05443633_105183 [Chryseobacterium arachidis]
MDNTNKYLHIKHEGKNVYEIVDELMGKYKSPLVTIQKIREIFPQLSLIEAKEVVIIKTSEHKSLYDYQGSLFPDLQRFLNEENDNNNL